MSYEYFTNTTKTLDLDWFKLKKTKFKEEPFYNQNKGIIEVVIDEIDQEGETVENRFSVTLNQYCFNSSFPNSNSEYIERYDIDDSKQPVDLNSILVLFEKDIDSKIGLLDTTADKIKFLYAIKDCLSQQVKENLIGNGSEVEYHAILEAFLNQFRNDIRKRYMSIFQVQDLVDWSANKEKHLYFDLNQEELGALLYILEKAGFFAKGKNQQDSGMQFLDFALDYFHVTNQKQKKFTRPEKIKDRYRKARSNNNTIAYQSVKNRLLTALKG